jgi:nucleoid DNA-binding protein
MGLKGGKPRKKRVDNLDKYCQYVHLGHYMFKKRFGLNLGYKKVDYLYRLFLNQILDSLHSEARVTLRNFGTFKITNIPGYIIPRVDTKVKRYVDPHRRVTFTPSPFTKDVINGRRSVGEKGEYNGDIEVKNDGSDV